MSHRFNDLLAEDIDGKRSPINDNIKIGDSYTVNIGYPTKYGYIIFITFYDTVNKIAAGRVGFYLDKINTRYFYNPIYSSTIAANEGLIGWRNDTNNLQPFFDHMRDNHQEVAEWLLWYI